MGEISVKWILPGSIQLTGLGSGGVSGKLAEVIMVFLDKKRSSPSISLKAFLVDSDTVPLIIGFEDILTDIKLVCDYKSKTAFFQIPSSCLSVLYDGLQLKTLLQEKP